ncbi:MAG: hypothetical protein JNL43_12350 [Flavobacteriales bacterium]|nr:hypothetical protein [Flavobacteriales bacterium]
MNKLREKIEPAEAGPEQGKAGKARTAKATSAGKPAEPGRGARMSRALIGVLNGSFLTREKLLGNMPFILFCAGLMITYIAYGYHTERIVRDLDRTATELKEMNAEYITVKSSLETKEQQSRVAAGISDLGLRESRVPPVKLEVEQEELENTRTP